ncbi:MAG TPA: PQQ-binding-like beta-propeller repeat protein [Verrucomicrobiales bacterium]|jgi:outer membrane protein assembly factor BamB|nr:PQQ-binding-like beta-propeller repeat protein [Verrucomicrobiales bacterium]
MKPSILLTLASFAGLLAVHAALPAKPGNPADWPSYRGPNGDGITTADFGKPWAGSGPKEIWKTKANNGFSSITVSGNVACTLETRDFEGSPTEHCIALNATNGKEVWAMPMKLAKYQGGGDEGGGGDGARSTPTISGDKVYAYGCNLDLYCFEAKTGKVLWKKDIPKEYGGRNISWQNATSPLIEDDLVIVSGGGKGAAFLAFDKNSGMLKWKTGDDTITHATPTPATIHGVRQIIFFTQKGLVAVTPKDGKTLWSQPFKFSTSTAASPVAFEDVVYCSAGYGVGGGAFKVEKKGDEWTSTPLWRKEGNDVANHWSTPVCKDGYLYGMFQFKNYGKGPVKCVDIRTGEVKWTKEGFGPGNVIMSGDRVLALSDKGELVLFNASPDGYKELARADVLDGKCWSTPTLAGGRIFARSTTQAGAFEIVK